jgi:hypothetical protein
LSPSGANTAVVPVCLGRAGCTRPSGSRVRPRSGLVQDLVQGRRCRAMPREAREARREARRRYDKLRPSAPVRFPSREQAAQVREALRRAGTSARDVLTAWAQGELVGAQEAARAAEDARRQAAEMVSRERAALEAEACKLVNMLLAARAGVMLAGLEERERRLREREDALAVKELRLSLRERRFAELVARLRGISANAALNVVREAVSAVSSDGVPAIVTKFLDADLLANASSSTRFRNNHKPGDVV